MQIAYDLDPSAKLVTMRCENASVAEWLSAMRAVIAEARYRPGFSFLLDQCGLVAAPATDELRAVAQFVRTHALELEQSRWAVVAHTPLALAMARVSSVFFEEFGVEVRAFDDAAAARAWLCSAADSHTPRPPDCP